MINKKNILRRFLLRRDTYLLYSRRYAGAHPIDKTKKLGPIIGYGYKSPPPQVYQRDEHEFIHLIDYCYTCN